MKKTILITGGAGYIGSHTAYTMAQLGHKIIILDDLVYNQPFNHRWATLIKSDYGDVQALRNLFSLHQIDAVMHFASFIEVGRSTHAPLDFYHNNVSKTITLLQVMLEYNVKKIIFSSSCAVYGVPDSVPIAESCAKNPLSPYGKTKLMIEHILTDAAAAHGLQFVGLRYFNAAGVIPNTDLYEFHEPETHLIPLLIKAARNNLPFYIFGNQWPTPDGTCIRDFLHVADIARAHAQALNYLDENKPNDFFNLGTGTGFSVQQIINSMKKISMLPINTVVAPVRNGDPAILIADAAKAARELNWTPQFSNLDYILQTAWDQESVHIEQSKQKHISL